MTNQIVPFATGANANTLAAAVYAALPAVQTGFVSGPASSAQMNTALRQVSTICSALAQFVADTLAVDVMDDGNVVEFEGLLEQALSKYANAPSAQSLVHGGPDSGGINALSIAAAPVITSLRPYMLLVSIPQYTSIAATAQAPATLTVTGGFSPVSGQLLHVDGTPLQPSDCIAGNLTIFICDGVNWRVVYSASPQNALWHVGVDNSRVTANITFASPLLTSRVADTAYLIVPANNCGGATTIDVGFGPTPLTRGDTTPLKALDYVANQPLIIIDDGTQFRLNGVYAGQGLKKTGSSFALDIPDLTEQDAIAAGDAFVYYDVSATAHVKVPFSVLAVAVLAGFAAQPHSALTLNPKVMQFQQQRSGSSSAVRFSTGGTGVFITRALNTEVANQVNPGVALNTSNNYVTLPANAAYRISAQGMHHGAGQSAIRIYDRTNNVELIRSPSSDSHVDYPDHQSSYDTNVTLGAQILNFRLVVGSTPIQISLDHASFASSALGSMGDDATGYTTIDADLYILQEAGSQ